MRINTINNKYPENSRVYYTKNTTPNFTGFGLRLPAQNRTMKQLAGEKDIISSLLNIPLKEVNSLTKEAPTKKVYFLKSLAHHYNSRNYYATGEHENIESVINIYNNVGEIDDIHYQILKCLSPSIENLNKLYSMPENRNLKNLKNVMKFYDKVLSDKHLKSKDDILINILGSKHGKSIIKEPDKYKSYILLNNGKERFIENLTAEIDNKTFNQAKYDRQYDVFSLFSHDMFAQTDIFNPDKLEKSYSKEGINLLKTFYKSSRISHNAILDGNDADVLKMYKTTNAKNFDIRKNVINNFVYVYTKGLDTETKYWNEAKYLSALFDKIDNDKEVKKFVKHLIDDKSYPESIENLFNIVDSIPAKKLNRFYSNVLNIKKQVPSENLVQTLKKEIENPFFKTPLTLRSEKEQYKESDSILTKTGKYIKNKINLFIYRNFEKSNITSQTAPAQTQEIHQITAEPKIIIIPRIADKIKPLEPVKPEVIKVEIPTKPVIKKSLSNTEAKRLLLVKDVNNFIEKHLTKRMLELQQGAYSEKATKMRLNLLPEIFSSISETRKTDRFVGKTHGSSSKYDAVKLYQRINGNNKKVVNYMLKKRNVDGTRMYDIKTILAILDKSEKRIAAAKKVNPDLRAKDVKSYYNKMYDNMIEQYGKVKPLRSFKSSDKV